MTDTTTAPPADEKPDPVALMLEPSEHPPELSDTETEEVEKLHESLKQEAALAYVSYFLSHTPERFQDAMKGLVTAPS